MDGLSSRRMLVTGGAGFIGGHFIRSVLSADENIHVTNLDALTYAASLAGLEQVARDHRYRFVHGNVADAELVSRILVEDDINTIVHFAAESHVDRSIHSPRTFIDTNIVGTFQLLEQARSCWQGRYESCRFLHVSTDEVYGTLRPDDPPFREMTPYAPKRTNPI